MTMMSQMLVLCPLSLSPPSISPYPTLIYFNHILILPHLSNMGGNELNARH